MTRYTVTIDDLLDFTDMLEAGESDEEEEEE